MMVDVAAPGYGGLSNGMICVSRHKVILDICGLRPVQFSKVLEASRQ